MRHSVGRGSVRVGDETAGGGMGIGNYQKERELEVLGKEYRRLPAAEGEQQRSTGVRPHPGRGYDVDDDLAGYLWKRVKKLADAMQKGGGMWEGVVGKLENTYAVSSEATSASA
ncbi:hypothetical protein S40288_11672, partial [Stachybotrys chartarum IBT 40288]